MTIQKEIWNTAIRNVTQKLEQFGILEAKSNAEYLAMYILGIWEKAELRRYLDQEITKEDHSTYDELIARRLQHEPLQHILGETEFFGLRILTSPAALIPRPDTEILVEEAVKEALELSKMDLKILDIGTGSGAIALALASKLPNASVIGIDINSDAVDLAERNKKRLKIENVDFRVSDIFHEEIIKTFSVIIDLLVSNPPYISAEEFITLEIEVREFDPRIALTDESDGLTFYRRIADLAPKILAPKGKILVEIGYGNAEIVKKIFTAAGLNVLRTVKDLQGIERVMIVSK